MSQGPLINPSGEPRIEEVDGAVEFHRQMQKQARRTGKTPRVRVIIQVRGHVIPVDAYRTRLARALRHMDRRGVPADERGPLLERAMQEADTRSWETVETFWEGTYDRSEVKLPSPEKLEQVKQKHGAAEAKAAVRAAT